MIADPATELRSNVRGVFVGRGMARRVAKVVLLFARSPFMVAVYLAVKPGELLTVDVIGLVNFLRYFMI